MTHIELFGCTGAGKTTLVAEIQRSCRELGVVLRSGDDVALGRLRLERLESYFLRTLFVDLVSLWACLWSFRRYRDFHRLAFRQTLSLRAPILHKLRLMRNLLKKIGIFEVVGRSSAEGIVLVDEGTLHTAHFLFVHAGMTPPTGSTSEFIDVVPLPEIALYATQRESVLVERTLARGHPRLPGASRSEVETFVGHAVDTFDEVAGRDVLKARLFRVDLDELSITAPAESAEAETFSELGKVLGDAVARLRDREAS